MEPIRVLQVLASLDRGGAESMIMNIYRAIDRSKIQFDFVVNEQISKYAFEAEIEKLGGRVYRIPRYTIVNYFSYKKAWGRLLSTHPEWKIIHGHHTSPAFIYLKVANTFNRVTIAHSHTAGGEKTIRSRTKAIMRYPLRYIADYLFACSSSASQWMFGTYSDSALIINNAIDTPGYIYNDIVRRQKRIEFNIESGAFVIGHVGSFQKVKNHSYLLQIFKRIHDALPSAKLMLIGDGGLRTELENTVKLLELQNSVIFTGIRSDVPQLLQAMDVFIFPSISEGLPVTLIEAQASGLPCLVSDAITKEVAVTDLVDFVSLSESPEIWAEKALAFVEGYERRNTQADIIKAGYDVKEVAELLEDFYFSKV